VGVAAWGAAFPRVINSGAHSVDSGSVAITKFVDKGVARLLARTYCWSCPKGPPGTEDTAIASTFHGSVRSLWALLCPQRVAREGLSPGFARRDVTGIPVSVLPSGERSRGPRPSFPWTLAWRPARP
jgi:hypothetical protein